MNFAWKLAGASPLVTSAGVSSSGLILSSPIVGRPAASASAGASAFSSALSSLPFSSVSAFCSATLFSSGLLAFFSQPVAATSASSSVAINICVFIGFLMGSKTRVENVISKRKLNDAYNLEYVAKMLNPLPDYSVFDVRHHCRVPARRMAADWLVLSFSWVCPALESVRGSNPRANSEHTPTRSEPHIGGEDHGETEEYSDQMAARRPRDGSVCRVDAQ